MRRCTRVVACNGRTRRRLRKWEKRRTLAHREALLLANVVPLLKVHAAVDLRAVARDPPLARRGPPRCARIAARVVRDRVHVASERAGLAIFRPIGLQWVGWILWQRIADLATATF